MNIVKLTLYHSFVVTLYHSFILKIEKLLTAIPCPSGQWTELGIFEKCL